MTTTELNNIIKEVREKIKNNPKYTHPCNKDFQEDTKRLGFNSGHKYIAWMQQNGILKSVTKINRELLANAYGFDNHNDFQRNNENNRNIKFYKRLEDEYGKEFVDWAINNSYIERKILSAGCTNLREYNNKIARNLGFKDWNDYRKNWRYETGRCFPSKDNEDCSQYFGIVIFEEIIERIFKTFQRMPPNNPKFDYICGNGYKIQAEARCLMYYNNNSRLEFRVDYNNIADYFLFGGFDNRIDKNLLYLWLIHKNEIIRGIELWKRNDLSITNSFYGIEPFKKYEVIDKLDKFKECMNRRREYG